MLKTIRRERGITQEELASAIGVTARAVKKWESLGIRHATVANAEKAAGALGCTLDDLLKKPDE